jgi:hypothetical protein
MSPSSQDRRQVNPIVQRAAAASAAMRASHVLRQHGADAGNSDDEASNAGGEEQRQNDGEGSAGEHRALVQVISDLIRSELRPVNERIMTMERRIATPPSSDASPGLRPIMYASRPALTGAAPSAVPPLTIGNSFAQLRESRPPGRAAVERMQLDDLSSHGERRWGSQPSNTSANDSSPTKRSIIMLGRPLNSSCSGKPPYRPSAKPLW